MALFANFAEFQTCVAVNNSFELFDYTPFADRAAKRFVYPYLSKEMYEDLLANRADTNYADLLHIVQRAVASYAMYLATPRINAHPLGVRNSSLRRRSSGEIRNSTKP